MIYWSLFTILLFFSIKEFISGKREVHPFLFIYSFLSVLLCLRQGQGTDYYNYYQIYKEVEFFSEKSLTLVFSMRDPLYSFLNWCFIKIGLSYPYFVAFFSALTMIIQWKYFRHTCKGSCICLFIFYSTIVLPYDFNAMRQGLALAVMLGILFPLLLKKKYSSYFFITVFTCFIHLSAIICLAMPIAHKLKIMKKTMAIIILLGTIFIFFGGNIIKHLSLPDFLMERVDPYTTSASTQLFAVLNRLLLLLPIFLIPNSVYKRDERICLLRNIILLGFIIYSIFSFNDFIASRENIYFRVFEGYFMSLILLKGYVRINRKLLFGYYVLLCCILFTKEISSSIGQGRYKNCNILTYPYFSVFDNNNTIKEYRTDFGFVDGQL